MDDWPDLDDYVDTGYTYATSTGWWPLVATAIVAMALGGLLTYFMVKR